MGLFSTLYHKLFIDAPSSVPPPIPPEHPQEPLRDADPSPLEHHAQRLFEERVPSDPREEIEQWKPPRARAAKPGLGRIPPPLPPLSEDSETPHEWEPEAPPMDAPKPPAVEPPKPPRRGHEEVKRILEELATQLEREPSRTRSTPAEPEPRSPAPRPSGRPAPKPAPTRPSHERYDLPPPFHLKDGRTLRHPQELAEAALDMSEDTFHHHNERGDFARWLDEAHRHPNAAHAKHATTPAELVSAIIRGPVIKPPIPITSLLQQKPSTRTVEAPLFARPEPKELEESPSMPVPERPTRNDSLQAEVAALRDEVAGLKDALSAELASGMRALLVRGDQERIVLEERRLQELRSELESVNAELDRRRDELRHAPEPHVLGVPEEAEEEAPQPSPAPHQGLAREDSLHDHLLSLVKSARAQLDRGDLDEARRTYASVRDQFYQAPIPEDEKQELYNRIHGLYTDIELASLE